MLRPTGFFRAKTNSVIKLSAAIVERFDGEVPGRLDRPRDPAGGGPQDRQRRAGQRVRRARHHRRHALRPAGAPVRLDRPRPTRSRSSTPIGALFPQARLDHAQPRADLPRPAHLPRPQARLRRLPGRAVVPVLRRGRDRPREGARSCSPTSWPPGAVLPDPPPGPLPGDPPGYPRTASGCRSRSSSATGAPAVLHTMTPMTTAPARRPGREGRRDRPDARVARRARGPHRRRRARVVRHLRAARRARGAARPCSCSSARTRAAARTSCSPSGPTPCGRTRGRCRSPAAGSTPTTTGRWPRRCARPRRRSGSTRPGVEVLATFPDVFLAPSQHAVTPVLAWWPSPVPVGVVDRGEVERVLRVPVADLLDPGQPVHRGVRAVPGPGVRGGRPVRVGLHRDAAQQPVRPRRRWPCPGTSRVERPLPDRVMSPWMRGTRE